jgi:nucleotide-binding universal stress UspA family protein
MVRRRWIVVGTDFSPAADCALDRAAALASELNASVAVVHAYDDPAGARLETDPMPLAKTRLEETVSPLRARYPLLRFDCLVRRGAPWDKLINVACELGAKMIVVGAGGERARENSSFLGHVATRLAAMSPRSVLVIPNADERLPAAPSR